MRLNSKMRCSFHQGVNSDSNKEVSLEFQINEHMCCKNYLAEYALPFLSIELIVLFEMAGQPLRLQYQKRFDL
jgi:hypothetical protein